MDEHTNSLTKEEDTLSTNKKNRILNPRLFSTIKKIDVCWYIDCAQSAQYKYKCSVPYEPSAKYKCTKPGSEDPVGPDRPVGGKMQINFRGEMKTGYNALKLHLFGVTNQLEQHLCLLQHQGRGK